MKKVIRFTASWCQPCKMLAKTLEDIETNVPIEVIDIDEQSQVAMEFGIRGVPTLVMIDDEGNVTDRLIGVHPKTKIENWLQGQ